jgi:hypothetical protein
MLKPFHSSDDTTASSEEDLYLESLTDNLAEVSSRPGGFSNFSTEYSPSGYVPPLQQPSTDVIYYPTRLANLGYAGSFLWQRGHVSTNSNRYVCVNTFKLPATIYTQTENTQTKLNLKPVLSPEWASTETFTAVGGVLETHFSAVKLEVPAKAVERGTHVSVKFAPSTNLASAYNLLSMLPKNVYIASPVAEFYAGSDDFKFQRPVRISLPHFLPANVSAGQVKVFMFCRDSTGSIILKELRLENKDNQKRTETDVFFLEGDRAVVLTDHFSGYFCAHCETGFVPQELNLVLLARVMNRRHGARREMDVRLEIWDNRLKVKDFEKVCKISF